MLIRCKGYNSGVKEYLEEGIKNGRDFTREELDERIILDGDLNVTEAIYKSIEDKGQERYLTFTLSFKEDEVSLSDLQNITQDFKSHMMGAYRPDEFNFYSEAHIPIIKETIDKKSGAKVVRKPHIHIIIPRKNILSGNEINPCGDYASNVKYFEAFQEHINNKYSLQSPRDNIRINPVSSSDILSRYKGDDFQSKNREFKTQLVKDVIDKNITSRSGFYELVSGFGETKIRNKGRGNEYIAVKLEGDKKFTNLKETIFHDDFIVNRQLRKEPLSPASIAKTLNEWETRSKELKYVSKATPNFRKQYKEADPQTRQALLSEREINFYKKFGGENARIYSRERENGNKRSSSEIETRGIAEFADGLQSLSRSDVAAGGDNAKTGNQELLPSHAHIHMGQQESTGNTGLRHDLRTRRGGRTWRDDLNRFSNIRGVQSVAERAERHGYRIREGMGGLNKPQHSKGMRISKLTDIQARARLLFGDNSFPAGSKYKPLSPIRKLIPKQSKDASFLAAHFLRKHLQNQILPEHRRDMKQVDNQFFSSRRLIMSDRRLTKVDKQQYLSVLTFERLKAHLEIRNPSQLYDTPTQEINDMASADIRKILRSKRIPENSISAPELPIRDRFSKIISNINEHMADKRAQQKVNDKPGQEREEKNTDNPLSAGDLYTKKARFSENVHYLDKSSDKTMFVDTGKVITVRRNAMSEASVAVALELAKEKFGSTLSIKGSDKFKATIIEVVAKQGMDIHFTNKDMNTALKERLTELALEREGQSIEQPDLSVNEGKEEPIISAFDKEFSEKKATAEQELKEWITNFELNRTKTEIQPEAASNFDKEFNERKAIAEQELKEWITNFELNKAKPDVALDSDNDFNEQKRIAEQELKEWITDFELNKAKPEAKSPSAHEGILLDHGNAAYKFEPDLTKPEDKRIDSYYVRLLMDDGKIRTLWGVDLESAVNTTNSGDRVRFEDHGIEHKTWQEKNVAGEMVQKSGQRRSWTAETLERAVAPKERNQPENDQDAPVMA
jgi:hypothetical protein